LRFSFIPTRQNSAANTLLVAGAAARRLQITAENAADSYACAMKKPRKTAGKASKEGCQKEDRLTSNV
jgi:hypothetical protein